MKYIHAAKFFLHNTTENEGYLEITDDGFFGNYLPLNQKIQGEIIDYGKNWIAPGLMDTHIHGIGGHDVMDNDAAGLEAMSMALLQCGVTSWLPTTITGSKEQLADICTTIATQQKQVSGAKIAGINFEGPFFTAEHKGAQNPKYFLDPDVAVFEEWQAAANGLLRQITIAPERSGAVAFTQAVSSTGVVVALGHSSATFAQAKACVEAGAKTFTHAYNGMSPLNHREPGMVGAALSLQGIDAELICDGHHVNPYAAKILIDAKTPEHTVLVTDCMSAGLMPDGDYMLGELPVVVANGTARLKDSTHNLAGSILRLNEAIKNLVNWNLVTPAQAIQMASATPAKSTNLAQEYGAILPGRAADFIVLDEQMNLQATYIDGQERYSVGE
ncbi:N-acetylglucosamine-6-phosphate deacetylase [Bombilactobacillus thymidiniphilus]|uniref:N-acetylglucosamine-6-phosphate deacetylase n=1 Tax=Bombilactobacillus thymidiniphilus TaxID=2923363 RepID=A0ABY4PF60_9LACO|nr:N-acetylglucosamine-6-phosphate deacetylase [Bombilactobacillus thymidiniphilus]UQS84156.1 N-acetylglucosamine-6-phosphate deacetylase [Bombilactobacillus thymidiniphilus]